MKKLLPFLALLSFSSFGAELTLTLTCKTVLVTDGDVAELTERPVSLSTTGKNAHVFQTELGTDQDNSVVAALQEVSKVCGDASCATNTGTVYSLILARIEDPTRNALQMAPKAKVEGKTSATVQVTVLDSGKVTSSYMNGDKLVMGAEGLPSVIGFEYKVSRKKYAGQKVAVSCAID